MSIFRELLINLCEQRKKGFRLSRFPIFIAFLAALLFGAATPASKALLQALPAFQLAGLLYLGAAFGVLPLIFHERRFSWPWNWNRKTGLRLIGAISMGGMLGPVFLLFGLRLSSSASVSLWLNLELIAKAITHSHPHWPDPYHRHKHSGG